MTVVNTLKDDNAKGFELIVAADVLVYFGSLEKLLQVFGEVSLRGAVLVVSCERTTAEEAPLGVAVCSTICLSTLYARVKIATSSTKE